jgi:hypothetical protein
MKALPTGLGAEPKKLAILGVLVVVLIGAYLLNRTPDSPGASASAGSPVATRPAPVRGAAPLAPANRDLDSVPPMPARRTQRNADSSIQDFKPTLKPPEGTDVSRIDPTLHLDVIAKLRDEPLEGGARSIFDFGAPPAPKTLPVVAPIKPGPGGPAAVKPGPPPTPPAPAKPVIPPIPLKFYGYVDASSTVRRAFFMQGDDIFVAGENDMVNNRYKILHITANSAIVEDMTTKNQQTLPLVEELPG